MERPSSPEIYLHQIIANYFMTHNDYDEILPFGGHLLLSQFTLGGCGWVTKIVIHSRRTHQYTVTRSNAVFIPNNHLLRLIRITPSSTLDSQQVPNSLSFYFARAPFSAGRI
jgi:hypothetical protein